MRPLRPLELGLGLRPLEELLVAHEQVVDRHLVDLRFHKVEEIGGTGDERSRVDFDSLSDDIVCQQVSVDIAEFLVQIGIGRAESGCIGYDDGIGFGRRGLLDHFNRFGDRGNFGLGNGNRFDGLGDRFLCLGAGTGDNQEGGKQKRCQEREFFHESILLGENVS